MPSLTLSKIPLNNSLALSQTSLPESKKSLALTTSKDSFESVTQSVSKTLSESKEKSLGCVDKAVGYIRIGGAVFNHMLVWGLNSLSKLRHSLAPDASNVVGSVVNLIRKAGNGFNEIAKEGKGKIDVLTDAIRIWLRNR